MCRGLGPSPVPGPALAWEEPLVRSIWQSAKTTPVQNNLVIMCMFCSWPIYFCVMRRIGSSEASILLLNK